jgi:mutator protein MutT
MNTIIVAAAVIERGGRFLVTRRLPGSHLAGMWEFPGGKCQPGESVAVCLARELKEELDVDARIAEEMLTTTHHYGDRAIELHFIRCELLREPAALLGQEMRWVERAELSSFEFPPADAELIRMLTTPLRPFERQ